MADKPKDQEPKKSNEKKLNLEKLGDFFDAADVEWRAQRSGYNARTKKAWVMVMPFITNRGVMARLDEVCTPAGWRNEYKDSPGITKGVLCGISILIDGEWITKWDGADQTSMEAVKGGLSNSMKRAAVQWGIGRYLYMMETQYVEVKEKGQHYIKSARDQNPQFKGYWTDPELPAWAKPGAKPDAAPKNFKWKDPEDLEVSTPEIEEAKKQKELEERQAKKAAQEAARDRSPAGEVDPAAEPPAADEDDEGLSDQEKKIRKFQDLMAKKFPPEMREIFCSAVINKPRPKTMGEIEILIEFLKKRADRDLAKEEADAKAKLAAAAAARKAAELNAEPEIILDDDQAALDASIDQAMAEAMERDKS